MGVVDEAQRPELGPGGLVVGDRGGRIPALHGHRRIEPGGPGPQRGRAGVAPGDLIGEDQLEELAVGEPVRLCQGEALGEGVEELAQLHPA
ncbi:MAG TPA: hypothetical protein VGV93_04550 [Acidimicrobiales bacterium]|nr:hypothetical protein [Acidimicrobiales bacterium]